MCKENKKQNHDNKRPDQLGSGPSNKEKRSNNNVNEQVYKNYTKSQAGSTEKERDKYGD